MKELWKDIPGYENLYEASNLGRIRTNINKVSYSKVRKCKRHWKQRILKVRMSFNKKGIYPRVSLWKNGQEKDWLVHRLIALTFIGKPPRDKPIINHKDGNKTNNRLDNLEWCDYKENLSHAYKNDLNKEPIHIKLINISNNNEKTFISEAKASIYLGKNKGYISNLYSRGKSNYKKYKIEKI